MPDQFAQYAVGSQDDPFAAFAAKSGEASPMTQGVLGHPLGASDETPSFKDRLVGGFVDNPMIQGGAHPQTLGDVTSLLMFNEVPTAMRVARDAVRPVVAPLERAAAAGLEKARALIPGGSAKNVIPFDKMAGRLRTNAQIAQDANMGVTRNDVQFPRSTEATARAVEPIAEAESLPVPSHLDLSRQARPGQLTPQQMVDREGAVYANRIQGGPPPVAQSAGVLRARTPMEPVPSHAPTVDTSLIENAERRAKQILPEIKPVDARVPTGYGTQPDNLLETLPDPSPAQITPPDMAAQEARFNRGSERLGREHGMSRTDAQAQTDSVQGTRADTSLVAPWEAQQRMMAKMEAMRKADPSGRSIVEYIDKAADPKTKAALINWERQSAFSAGRTPFYALASAAVAPSIRDMLLQRMRAGVTGRDSQ